MDVLNELEERLRLKRLLYEFKFAKLVCSEYKYNNLSKRLERQCRELLEEERLILKIIEYLNTLREEDITWRTKN